MKVNAELLLELRNEKSWSQDELAIASGLNLRTIQRIEKEATISLQSKKSLAAAFEVDIHDLDYKESIIMKNYEYKSVAIKFNHGWFKKGISNVDEALNEGAIDGWRFKQMVMPTDATGGTEQMIAIYERELAE
ncbi:MAG: DNA-binding XRE family transcriptional regulator [Alteromonadaceae bacterium]|jgi:DNA-binding XRE family transcriptional regulator